MVDPKDDASHWGEGNRGFVAFPDGTIEFAPEGSTTFYRPGYFQDYDTRRYYPTHLTVVMKHYDLPTSDEIWEDSMIAGTYLERLEEPQILFHGVLPYKKSDPVELRHHIYGIHAVKYEVIENALRKAVCNLLDKGIITSDTKIKHDDTIKPSFTYCRNNNPPKKKDKPKITSWDQCVSEFDKRLKRLSHGHAKWEIFQDFCQMGSIALESQMNDVIEDLEKQYLEIMDKYTKKETKIFSEMFGLTRLAFSFKTDDFLGHLFMTNELSSKWHGQFFTPTALTKVMVQVLAGTKEDFEAELKQKGFVAWSDPAGGSGGMLLVVLDLLQSYGVPEDKILLSMRDISSLCCNMAYIQLTLAGGLAEVVHGNTLTQETWSIRYTFPTKKSEEAAAPTTAIVASGPLQPPMEIES